MGVYDLMLPLSLLGLSVTLGLATFAVYRFKWIADIGHDLSAPAKRWRRMWAVNRLWTVAVVVLEGLTYLTFILTLGTYVWKVILPLL